MDKEALEEIREQKRKKREDKNLSVLLIPLL
jgi:hypothetical protein